MNPRFQRFQREFEHIDLAKYFNLCPDLIIQHTIEENRIHLRIRYQKIFRCPRLPIPIEMIREVQSYLIHPIELFLRMIFTREYPFVAPVWTLLDVQHAPCSRFSKILLGYYQDKIDQHNQYYNVHWTPAISISGDILDFIRRVNHFEEMFDCIL